MGTVTLPVLGPDPFTVNASVLNGKVDPLATEFNGNIENVNIASGAAIASSKLNLSTVTQVVAMSGKEFLTAKGADVASGTSITLGTDGNVFDITGTTTIQTITAKQAGSVVILHFDGALTLTDDTGNLELQGSDFAVRAEDEVVLKSDGTLWHLVASSKPTSDVEDNPRSLDVVTAETTIMASSTSEETAYTFSVPANTLSTNNYLRLSVWGLLTNNSGGGTQTDFRLKYGSTTIATLTDTDLATSATANVVVFQALIKGDGTTGSQEGVFTSDMSADGGVVGAAQTAGKDTGTAAEDSTGALNLLLTGQSDENNAAISFVLKSATLELMEAL